MAMSSWTSRSLSSMESLCPHVILIGPMGVGKTSVGRELARLLDRPFLDSDAEVERSSNETAAHIAAAEGVEALHSVELDVFTDMLACPKPAVIAAAASVVDSGGGRELMASCITVALTASPEVLARRARGGSHRRPLAAAELDDLGRRRASISGELALLTVDTSDLSASEAAGQIATRLDTE